jgi:hypothetical protein
MSDLVRGFRTRLKATERKTNACRKGRNVFFAINGIMSNSTKPSVFGEVLIHDTSSASEGTQALHIYINRLID